MRVIQPEATDLVCPLISGNHLCSPIKVTVKSPKTHRKAVYRIAQFFRREFRYDFVQ